MTVVKIKGQRWQRIVNNYPAALAQPQTVHHERNREIKKLVDNRKVEPSERIARLVKLAHEHGPEKLQHEIAVHKRKIAELEAAIAQFEKE